MRIGREMAKTCMRERRTRHAIHVQPLQPAQARELAIEIAHISARRNNLPQARNLVDRPSIFGKPDLDRAEQSGMWVRTQRRDRLGIDRLFAMRLKLGDPDEAAVESKPPLFDALVQSRGEQRS